MFGFIVIIFVISQMASAQLFLPKQNFDATLGENTKIVISGETRIQSNTFGIHIPRELIPFDPSYIAYLSIWYPELNASLGKILSSNNIRAYPLFIDIGHTKMLDKVYMINISNRQVKRFSNVKVFSRDGYVVLAGINTTMEINENLPYAISTFVNMRFIENENSSFLIFLTRAMYTLRFSNSPSYIIVSAGMFGDNYKTGIIGVEDNAGKTVWSGSDRYWMAVLESNKVSLYTKTKIEMVPLENMRNGLIMDARESNCTADALEIIENGTSILSESGGESIGTIKNVEMLSGIIRPLMGILNGAFINIGNGSINIDHAEHKINSIGLIRFNQLHLTKDSDTYTNISGNGKLIFLGDRVYNTIPTERINSIDVPTQPIAIWILSAGVIILFSFVFKSVEKRKDKRLGFIHIDLSDKNKKIVKWTGFISHVLIIIFVFLIFDMEFGYVLGVGFISSLFEENKNLMVSGAILGIESLYMTLSYIFFALPIRYATNSVLGFIGMGKEGRPIGKSVGLIAMCILGIPYINYLLNILASFMKDMIPIF